MEVSGLTEAEVQERIRRGEVNKTDGGVSRSYIDIVAKNVLTTFNLILFALGAILVIVGEPVDALAATGIISLNILIATFQEIKAKRRLDKIAVLLRPKATVVRDGVEVEINYDRIVLGDVIVLEPGTQALVDGTVLISDHLEMNEALLTGEASTIGKKADTEIHSGSFCVTGRGYYVAEALGKDTLASKMLVSAKKYDVKNTPLQMETTAITKLMMSLAFVYLFLAVLVAFLGSEQVLGNGDIAKLAVVIMDIVPIALPLLIVVAYMVAAVRLADTGVLLQRSNSVESMSHVDTVCMDKTGTITTNRLLFNSITPFTDAKRANRFVSLYCGATGGRNSTVEALEAEFGSEESVLVDQIYFSSERKFSAVRIEFDGTDKTLFLGALSSLSDYFDDPSELGDVVRAYSDKGLRTVVLAESESLWSTNADGRYYVPRLSPVAVIALEDEIRTDCRETIAVFAENDMDLKIISGDDPAAVDALFSIAGIPGERKIISGEELGDLEGEMKVKAILESNIFGRMKPDQKVDVIDTLKDNGRYVAMVGDGVNDVQALKSANVSVSMYSAAAAARGVSDMVLVNDDFSALPRALEEGRRTLAGMGDILRIYLSRNFVLLLMIALILVVFKTIPLHPTQVAFYAFTATSVMAFFMVIWAKPRKVDEAILPGVLQYAVPMAVVITAVAFTLYTITFLVVDLGLVSVELSLDQLARLGWPTYPDESALAALGDAELVTRTACIVAQNMTLLFMVAAGILQVLFVSPIIPQTSIDGKFASDRRPTVLAVFLFALVAAAYNVPMAADIIRLLPPTYAMLAGVGAALIVWFLVSRYVLRRGSLKGLSDMTQRWYAYRFERTYGGR